MTFIVTLREFQFHKTHAFCCDRSLIPPNSENGKRRCGLQKVLQQNEERKIARHTREVFRLNDTVVLADETSVSNDPLNAKCCNSRRREGRELVTRVNDA